MTSKSVLYLSYNGALEPIFRSQGLSYLEQLSREGWKVVLLTFEKKEDLTRAGSGVETLRKQLEKKGIFWHFRRYHKRPPVLSTVWDSCIGFFEAWKLSRKYRVGLIHARGTIPASFGRAVSKGQRKPFLFDVRGFLAEEYADGGIWKRGTVVFRIVSRLEKFFLRSADGVVVLTQRARAYLQQQELCRADVPVAVIPCCVDLKRFETAQGRESRITDFRLLYAGSLGTWYLLEQMLDFYQILKKKIPAASFQILTQTRDQALRDRLRPYSEDGISVQEVSYEEIPERMSSAKAGISFIKPVFSKMVSSPVKIGEYLASGLPVILNPNVGDTETLIRENRVGVVVSGFETSCYEKAVEELADLLKEGDTLSMRCRNVASLKLSLEEGARRYDAMYRSLLEKRP